jgi:hypothetical protein
MISLCIFDSVLTPVAVKSQARIFGNCSLFVKVVELMNR